MFGAMMFLSSGPLVVALVLVIVILVILQIRANRIRKQNRRR